MNCDKFRENISYYIDDILDDKDKHEFEDHMNSCDECKCEYEQMLVLINSLNSVEQVPLPDNYDETLRKKLNNERVKSKRKWSKYMYIAASLAIVLFSAQNIDKLNTIDIQENTNMEISETANNEELQQSLTQNSDIENIEGDSVNMDKADIVTTVSDNEKANIDAPKKKELPSAYSMEPSIDSQMPAQNIQTAQKESIDQNEQIDNNNIMSMEMASDEPIQQKTRSIAQFSMNNEYQKHVKIGENFEIILQNPKGTKYSMLCEDENGLIQFISQSVSEDEETYSYAWKFKAIKEGSINISYILHDENDKNKVYNEVEYSIDIQK